MTEISIEKELERLAVYNPKKYLEVINID